VTLNNVGAGRGTDAQIRLNDCFLYNIENSFFGGDSVGKGVHATGCNVGKLENTTINNVSGSDFGYYLDGGYAVTVQNCNVGNTGHAYYVDGFDTANGRSGIKFEACTAEKLDATEPDNFRIGESEGVDDLVIESGHFRTNNSNVDIQNAESVMLISPGFGQFVDLRIDSTADVTSIGYRDPNDRTTGSLRELKENKFKGTAIEQDVTQVTADSTQQTITTKSLDGVVAVMGVKGNTDRFTDIVAGCFFGGGTFTVQSQDSVGAVGTRSYAIQTGDLTVSINDNSNTYQVQVVSLARFSSP
jgi:hypothetical protein